MDLRPLAALSLLLATTALAQNADLTLTLHGDATYNAGEISMLKATVKNLGPDPATAAGVRLKNVSPSGFDAARFGCFFLIDSVLCNAPTLAAGESHDFSIPFMTPDEEGPITLSARVESFTLDPDHGNDAASTTANVVKMPDLVGAMQLTPGLQPGKTSQLFIYATNAAAMKATGVRAKIDIPAELEVVNSPSNCQATAEGSWLCSVGDIARQMNGGVGFTVRPRAAWPDQLTISGSFEGSEADWNAADNRVTTTWGVWPLADFAFALAAPESLDQSNRATVKLTFSNRSAVASPKSTAMIHFGSIPIVSWDAPGWNCRQTEATDMECTTESIAAHSDASIDVTLQYPLREIRSALTVNMVQKPPVENFFSPWQTFIDDAVFFRTFAVTSSADSGPGSLRQAILDANAQCSADRYAPPCRITFAIPAPVPPEGWFTIGLLSPLPTITVTDFEIDGETQTAATGDTNSRGPEIFLLGENAGEGEGLRLICGLETIRGLAIGGFPLNGIMSFPRPNAYVSTYHRHRIERNYLGTDPSGSVAVSNGLRGLMAYRFIGSISGNVASGNRRSGIYLAQSDNVTITDNRIGIAATTADPVPNGATGIFILDSATFGDIAIERNIIAYNEEYGVSSSKLSRFSIFGNTFIGNRISIDLGLDGPTPGFYNGYIAPEPVLTSASYDAATRETVIEGSVPLQNSWFGYSRTATVYLYANQSALEEGEQFLGSAEMKAGQFTFRTAKDLRGLFITGTTRMVIDYGDFVVRMSSEFGKPVGVTR